MTDVIDGKVSLSYCISLATCGRLSGFYGDVLGVGAEWAKFVLLH